MQMPGSGMLDRIRLATENQRLTALLCALLSRGPITLSPAELDEVWVNPKLHYQGNPDGSLTLSLEGERSSKPADEEETDGV